MLLQLSLQTHDLLSCLGCLLLQLLCFLLALICCMPQLSLQTLCCLGCLLPQLLCFLLQLSLQAHGILCCLGCFLPQLLCFLLAFMGCLLQLSLHALVLLLYSFLGALEHGCHEIHQTPSIRIGFHKRGRHRLVREAILGVHSGTHVVQNVVWVVLENWFDSRRGLAGRMACSARSSGSYGER